MRWSLVTWRECRGYVRCNKAPTLAFRNAVPPAAQTVCVASAGCNQTRQCSGPSTLMYNGKAAMHGEPINHSGRRALQHQSINRLAQQQLRALSEFSHAAAVFRIGEQRGTSSI